MHGTSHADLSDMVQKVASVRVTLNNFIAELDSPVWSGPDANRFRTRWESEITATLKNIEYAIGNLTIQTYRE